MIELITFIISTLGTVTGIISFYLSLKLYKKTKYISPFWLLMSLIAFFGSIVRIAYILYFIFNIQSSIVTSIMVVFLNAQAYLTFFIILSVYFDVREPPI